MNTTKNNNNFLLVTGLILAAVIFRIIPHPFNITPIIAVALFAGAKYKDKKWAIIIPVITLFISDAALAYLNHYDIFHDTVLFTYGSLLMIILLGRLLNTEKSNIGKTIVITISSSLIFFVISNFGVWLSGNMYTMDLEGLINCYVMAIPFNKYSWLGDLFFVFTLFKLYDVLTYRNSVNTKDLAWQQNSSKD